MGLTVCSPSFCPVNLLSELEAVFDLPVLSGISNRWGAFLSFLEGIFSPSFLELRAEYRRECDCGSGIRKHTINIFKGLFLLHSVCGTHSSKPCSTGLGRHVPWLWEQGKGSDGKEASQHRPGNEVLLGFAWELSVRFPEFRRLPSDAVTWLVPRL